MCKKETNGVADFFLNQLFKKKTFKGLCHEISDSSSIIPFKTSDLEANIFSCVYFKIRGFYFKVAISLSIFKEHITYFKIS